MQFPPLYIPHGLHKNSGHMHSTNASGFYLLFEHIYGAYISEWLMHSQLLSLQECLGEFYNILLIYKSMAGAKVRIWGLYLLSTIHLLLRLHVFIIIQSLNFFSLTSLLFFDKRETYVLNFRWDDEGVKVSIRRWFSGLVQWQVELLRHIKQTWQYDINNQG